MERWIFARRRRLLLGSLLAPAASPLLAADGARPVRPGRVLAFPRDHGAHLDARTEWWYVTGWIAADGGPDPTHGLQVTFFRSRTDLAERIESRFAARHLLFAHAAVTSLADGRHRHDQRIARWSGAVGAALGEAAEDDARVRIGRWTLARGSDADRGEAAPWQARIEAGDFELDLRATPTQPLLLQGDAGYSRKGPLPQQASHYVSLPQLALEATVALRGSAVRSGRGLAWLDHEWSDEILARDAVGWDWIGINLGDGGALTAFVLRRADGSPVWAGGSLRRQGAQARSFGPDEVAFSPGRRWMSPATGARYPVEWQLRTPAGAYRLRALLDAQELDSRASTGTVYWEGLSELLDVGGRRVGLGYLEMTGYAGRLRIG